MHSICLHIIIWFYACTCPKCSAWLLFEQEFQSLYINSRKWQDKCHRSHTTKILFLLFNTHCNLNLRGEILLMLWEVVVGLICPFKIRVTKKTCVHWKENITFCKKKSFLIKSMIFAVQLLIWPVYTAVLALEIGVLWASQRQKDKGMTVGWNSCHWLNSCVYVVKEKLRVLHAHTLFLDFSQQTGAIQ